ncbi:hypothetical protein OS242_01830 [Tumebacillus sp. DT12]|uniref:Chromosome segregation ATPase n=1 Tax=Tumebacillus lacus TaxID=2995335 RepID=A0ABT3WVL2_9BACL|nr:hypothetical protein [Tumebacillus lacus]MCX7568709.1 hypothetical protein [Tumebacillus lacus]
MPAISKVRFANVNYEGGNKRYNDETFIFDGHNGALLLENGGGKTVFIQTLIQCVLPNSTMAERKMRDTLDVSLGPAHVAVEWILEESPREYFVTCVTFYMGRDGLSYLMYAFDYREGSPHAIGQIPFVKETAKGKRVANRDEIQEYYDRMSRDYRSNAAFFTKRGEYIDHLEERYRLVPGEWEAMLKINGAEGGVDAFFDGCKTMTQLVDKLLIPTVEQGLASNGTQDFYKLFENHREHFREYMALGEQLKEYQKIDEELQGIVDRYRQTDMIEHDYQRLQGKGKTLWLNMTAELEQVGERLEQLKAERDDLAVAEEAWKRRKTGLAVLVKKIAYEEKLRAFEAYLPVYQQIQLAERDAQGRFRSLEYKQMTADAEETQNKILWHEEQLRNMESDQTTESLERARSEYLSQAAYLYRSILQTLQEQRQAAQTRLEEIERDLRATEGQEKQAADKREDLVKNRSKWETLVETFAGQMSEIESEILIDPKDHVLQQRVKWSEQLKAIQTELPRLMKQKTTTKQEKELLRGQIKRVHEDLLASNQALHEAESTLSFFQEEEQRVLRTLQSVMDDLSETQGLHRKEETIRHRLDDKIHHLEKRVETSLESERLAYRFYDLYKENGVFSADPELEQWVEGALKDLPSLELGTQYVLRVAAESGRTLNELYEMYPLWPMTVITAAHDLEKVKQRLSHGNTWTHPIHLLTTAQAHSYLLGVWQDPAYLFTPRQWKDLTEPDSFRNWLEEQKNRATREKEQRKILEQERQQVANLAHSTKQFFANYPMDLIQTWRRQRDEALQKGKDSTRLLETLEFDEERIDDEMETIISRIDLLNDQERDLTDRIRKATRWEGIAQQRQQTLVDLEQERARLAACEGVLENLKQKIKHLQEEQAVFTARVQEARGNEHVTQGEDLYKRVQDLTPQSTQSSLPVLKDQIRDLDLKLMGINARKEDIENRLMQFRESLKRIRSSLAHYLDEYADWIDQELVFAGDLLAAVESAQAHWKDRKERFHEAQIKYQRLDQAREDARRGFDVKKDSYLDRYEVAWDGTVFGDSSVEVIEEQLELDRISIQNRSEQNSADQREATSLQKELAGVKYQLDLLSLQNGHSIGDPELSVVALSEQEQRDFPYQRLKFVKVLAKQLQEQKDRLQTSVDARNGQIAQFRRYLAQDVQEERVRQQILDGLRVKITYQDISDWSSAMHTRIQQVIQIAEQQQRESDQQVQHVISHLHSYLKNICQELNAIPKMTKVRFESGVKDIYDFTVPEWEDEEGLLRMRAHLEWMMKELEKDKYKNAQGHEEKDKVKKQVESWLHPTTLLQVINSANAIKVRCRKVTNDGKVSGAFTEWPSTEHWSGGEKWSKNMTLFLGILNYLAEKRGHLRPGHLNHRVVICDNPFGKASSDHVLSPVFHIAKQLGFQILALTAHAEGKFLRDYFPIVYSCKLRPTKDPSIAVMTKEKELHTAYLQDHAPKSLDRLGEEEQLSMLL